MLVKYRLFNALYDELLVKDDLVMYFAHKPHQLHKLQSTREASDSVTVNNCKIRAIQEQQGRYWRTRII